MSVSMKSTKAQMYSEIERLRALCDQQEQQLRAAREERKAKSDITECGHSKYEPCHNCVPREDREVTLSKIEIGKRLAILMKRSVRNAQGGGFESYVDGEWVAVPERVVRFACSGGAA